MYNIPVQVSVASMEVEDDVTVDEVFEVNCFLTNRFLQLLVCVLQESSNAATEMKEAAAKAKRAPRKKYKWTEETRWGRGGGSSGLVVPCVMCVWCVCVQASAV